MTQTLVLDAIVRVAADATAARDSWLALVTPEATKIVATSGEAAEHLRGVQLPPGGSIAYVSTLGQPLAVQVRPGDDLVLPELAALIMRTPASILSAPCDTGSDHVGVLEVVDKPGGFNIDDIELVSLLTTIAGAALSQIDTPPTATDPAILNRQLQELADQDPEIHRSIAEVVARLTGGR